MSGFRLPRFKADHSFALGAAAILLGSLLLPAFGNSLGIRTGNLLLVAVAQVFFLWRLRQAGLVAGPGQETRMWRYLAVGALMWGLARLSQAGYLVITGGPPQVPSLVDLLLVAGGLAAIAALIRSPYSTNPQPGMARDLLETAIIGGGSLVLFWLAVVDPALDVGFESPVTVAWMGVSPALDLVLMMLVLRLISLTSPKAPRVVLLLLAAAFFVRLPTDLAIGYGVLRGAQMFSGWMEVGWTLSPLLMAGAVHLRTEQTRLDQTSPGGRGLAQRLGSWFPFALVYLVAGYTLANWWLVGAVNWVGAVAAGVLALLLIGRQGVIAGQSEMRQYATLVQGAADLAFICDAQGELLLTNSALEAALGQERAAPTDLGEFLEGPLSPNSLLEQALDRGWSGEVEFKAADGARLPVALSLRPVVDERRAEPVLAGTAHDLTQLKRRERDLRRALHEVAEAREELQQLNLSLEAKVEARTQELEQSVRRLEKVNEELKELDRLKSEFVTLVSHELRAPLTNIRSGVELLLKDPDELPDSVEETLDLVSNETERLVDFVEIILDLSALEAGRFPLEFEPIEMAPLADMVAARFPAKGGGERIEVDMDSELPLVRGDERAVTSVLFHLLDNAIKYAQEGSVTVRGQIHGNNMRIAVCDEGPGIPAAAREAVFDRFHRLDASDSRQVYGRGLGLYLSRRLVEAMGGRIEASQSASGGAEVTFELPLYD